MTAATPRVGLLVPPEVLALPHERRGRYLEQGRTQASLTSRSATTSPSTPVSASTDSSRPRRSSPHNLASR